MEHKTLGPFLTSVQKQWREHVKDHIDARQDVLQRLDREVARQVIPLAKEMGKGDVKVVDMLIEAAHASDEAGRAWKDGRYGDVLRALLKVSVTSVFVLESLEIASKRTDDEPEK